MRRLNFYIVLSVLILAGFWSCSHPVAPTLADEVIISGPKSGPRLTTEMFTATINFNSQTELIYKWNFPDSTVMGMSDKIAWKFKDTGLIIFRVSVLQTGDSSMLCSTIDTFAAYDTIALDTINRDTIKNNPGDTTSSNFSWNEYSDVKGELNMSSCWVFGVNDIYAMNVYLYHFDGSSWSQASLNGQAPGQLTGFSIFGFNDNDFWMNGYDIIYHWNGSNVIETRLENTGVWHYPQDGSIHSSWGTSSSDMFFVGDSGTILHFDGMNWINFPKLTELPLYSIWGIGDNNIWACGFDESYTSVLLHYNGTAWTEVNLQGNFISSVWATDSAGHELVYTAGLRVWHKWDNGAWICDSVMQPNGTDFFHVSGNSSNDVAITRDQWLVYHWNGRLWNYYSPATYQDILVSDISMRGNTVCVVGSKESRSWVLVGQR
jgi:hypothetical protein